MRVALAITLFCVALIVLSNEAAAAAREETIARQIHARAAQSCQAERRAALANGAPGARSVSNIDNMLTVEMASLIASGRQEVEPLLESQANARGVLEYLPCVSRGMLAQIRRLRQAHTFLSEVVTQRSISYYGQTDWQYEGGGCSTTFRSRSSYYNTSERYSYAIDWTRVRAVEQQNVRVNVIGPIGREDGTQNDSMDFDVSREAERVANALKYLADTCRIASDNPFWQ